jgi:hypothetical protein
VALLHPKRHNDAALLVRLTDHREIVETGNEPWRFKNRSQS